jgi:hypothetical protein
MAGVTSTTASSTTVNSGSTMTWGLAWATLFFALIVTASWRSASKMAVMFSYLILVGVIFDTYSHHTFLTDITNTWSNGLKGNFSGLFTGSATSGANTAPAVGTTTPSGTTNVTGRTTNP